MPNLAKKNAIKSNSFKAPSAKVASLNFLRREIAPGNSFKKPKRPSTKEVTEREDSMGRNSEREEEAKNQFNTAYPIRTPVQQSEKYRDSESEHIYGLSKTNESFKKARWMSGSKTENSTKGFTSSTGNTTDYGKGFGDNLPGTSKNLQQIDQSLVTRSSFYM